MMNYQCRFPGFMLIKNNRHINGLTGVMFSKDRAIIFINQNIDFKWHLKWWLNFSAFSQ